MAGAGAIALSAPASAAGSTLLVNPDGADTGNCGTTVVQCQTIQYAVNKASAGDTIQLAGGHYNGAINITKAVTLQGAGADTTVIDGTGVEPTDATVALLAINGPGGDVTVDGVTIENSFPTVQTNPIAVSVIDPSADDTITFSHDTILGNASSASIATDAQVGIDASDTAAAISITHSDFSGTWQGVLLEGLSGPIDVSNNQFHNFGTWSDSGNVYPGEGVYVLSDKGTSGSDQSIAHNTFANYGGIGIAYSAGYNLGGCTDTTCDGTVIGSITDNTFALDANAGTVNASAIRLRALNAGDELNLTMGGNHGTVVAPTKTIEETPNAGAINITAGDAPNSIIPSPTPTVDSHDPTSVTTGADAVDFTATATNPVNGDNVGDTIANARYEITMSGIAGLEASDISLKYETEPGSGIYASVPLEAAQDGTIAGYFGPYAGFEFPASATPNETKFQLAIPSSDAPTGAITSVVKLEEVSSGSDNPVINTLATDTKTIHVVASSPTIFAEQNSATTAGKAVTITLPTATGEHGPFTYSASDATHGTATVSGTHAVFTPTAGFVGAGTFAYKAMDANGNTASGAETVTVTKATSALTVALSPASPTVANVVSAKVTVATTGVSTGGTVSVKSGTTIYTGKVANGSATIKLTKYSAAAHTLTVSYLGTASTSASTAGKTFTSAKVATGLRVSTSPATISHSTTNGKAIVTVSAPGATTKGATVTITGSTKVGSAKVSSNKATIAVPKLAAGVHKWTVTYAGTSTAAAKSVTYTFTVKA